MTKGIRKTGDIAPLGVRMPPEIKDALTSAARKNGRSVNAEIVLRLQKSFEEPVGVVLPAGELVAAENHREYKPVRQISRTEEAILEIFHKLPVEKQLALISLFK